MNFFYLVCNLIFLYNNIIIISLIMRISKDFKANMNVEIFVYGDYQMKINCRFVHMETTKGFMIFILDQ